MRRRMPRRFRRAGEPAHRRLRRLRLRRSGRLLTVRKRGTDKFMHPGGKPEAGETAAQAAARELQEEVGIVLAPDDLDLLGVWLADAANEAATQIEATVFTAPGVWSARPSAEIAEIRWLDLSGELPGDLAPLLTDHVLPALSAKPSRLGPVPARASNAGLTTPAAKRRLSSRARIPGPPRWPRQNCVRYSSA